MNQILNMEIRLLVLQFGRRAVLEALASSGQQTLEEIEAELRIAETRKSKRTRKTPTAFEALSETANARPEAEETLRLLAARYENRTFLPQLRDVQRFLDRFGSAPRSLRSRRDATRKVMRILSDLAPEELNQLARSSEGKAGSDYAELAREIMGKR